MTENEAIKVINDKYETFFALSTTNVFDIAMATAIKALEEIQQYREIGTIKQFEWCKDASHWKELFKEKLEKYEAIGTVEEFKQAMNFKKYFMELYGEGLEVANWHKNGDLEPLVNFIDEACNWLEMKGE